jgi:hypothetical protein
MCRKIIFNTNDEARRQKIENESGCELKKCSVYDISKYGNFRPHDFEAFFVPFNGAYQEKNIVIIKVQILEILFLVTRQKNVFLKLMDVKK